MWICSSFFRILARSLSSKLILSINELKMPQLLWQYRAIANWKAGRKMQTNQINQRRKQPHKINTAATTTC